MIDKNNVRESRGQFYTKDIVVLANSIKHGGRCIAGKDINTKKWVRLVTNDGSNCFTKLKLYEISGSSNGPKILDIIRVTFSHKEPSEFHPEDEYINGVKWTKVGVCTIDELNKLIDKDKDWVDETSHVIGKTERIPKSYFDSHQLNNSLELIKLGIANNVILTYEPKEGKTSIYYRPRLIFTYKDKNYDLPITYPGYGLEKIKPSDRSINAIFITIGLGEMYSEQGNDHFKLIVGAIEIKNK